MENTAGGRKRHWFWAIVPAVVLMEIVWQWRIPLENPDERDWARAAEYIKTKKSEHDLVVLAPEWADQGRKYLADTISFKDFGRFDITRYERIFEVRAFGATASEIEHLKTQSVLAFGNIEVRTSAMKKRADVLYDFRDHLGDAEAVGTGRSAPKIMIDREFHPRFAIPVSLSKGRGSLTFKDVPLEGVIRGYGFLDYREARYNQGKPVSFRIFLNGKKVSEQRIGNFEPIRPFEIELESATRGEVRFEIAAVGNLKREFGLTCDVRRAF